ncbi:MAG: hypothetical protein QOF76_1521 [Solirubrobacteraceae bacterium]|nr:hypothetical protein [Solirubrobacteraceae bacterium]
MVGGLLLLLNVFSGRDTGGLEPDSQASGPGTFESAPGNPPSSGATDGPNLTREIDVDDAALVKGLAQGNVAFVYATKQPPAGLRALQEEFGPFDPEVAAAGQTVFLVHRPGAGGILALAWKRRLQVSSDTDPQLTDFVKAWLGKGEGRTE